MFVACVLKSGGRYDASWVEKLQRGVAKNLSLKHEFVCLSDVVVPSCRTIPLERDWPGWWSKLELFYQFKKERVLYIDLDNIVVGSLDQLLLLTDKFIAAHDWTHSDVTLLNSTVLSWEGDYSFIPERFAQAPRMVQMISHYDKYLPRDTESTKRRIGDQAYIEDEMVGRGVTFFKDRLSETTIASYRINSCQIAYPKDAAVVSFHGKFKPNSIKDNWVEELWT